MQPLKQWVCDRCKHVIESSKDGWVEWLQEEGGGVRGFKIVHQKFASPLKDQRGCYHYSDEFGRKDLPLVEFLGERGIGMLLHFLRTDPESDQTSKQEVAIRNFQEYADLFRRLTISHYEEARQFFGEARDDGELDETSETAFYDSGRLKSIVGRYGPYKSP